MSSRARRLWVSAFLCLGLFVLGGCGADVSTIPLATPGEIVAEAPVLEATAAFWTATDGNTDGKIDAGDQVSFVAEIENSGRATAHLSSVRLEPGDISALCPGGADIEAAQNAFCQADRETSAQDVSLGRFSVSFDILYTDESGATYEVKTAPLSTILSQLPGATPLATPSPTPSPKPTQVPALKPKPTPTPVSQPISLVPTITASFFGADVSIKTYTITGNDQQALEASIEASGPRLSWQGNLEAETVSTTSAHWQYETDTNGHCRIVDTATPAITVSFVIDLPYWQPTSAASKATISWWGSELTRVATHEKHHVTDGQAAIAQANAVLATSTCANAEANLNQVFSDWQRTDCQFDMDEYGKANGLTLAGCMAQ
jgi:predicted secreted Zn-dependent protease